MLQAFDMRLKLGRRTNVAAGRIDKYDILIFIDHNLATFWSNIQEPPGDAAGNLPLSARFESLIARLAPLYHDRTPTSILASLRPARSMRGSRPSRI